MYFINRSAVIIKPRAPYLAWANALVPPEEKQTLEELREDSSCYLLPESDEPRDLHGLVKQVIAEIFREELFCFTENQQEWPKNLTYDTFLAWFDVEVFPYVTDLVDDKLLREDDEEYDAEVEE